ncbi:MAG: efflux RND transporter periplasmic adaptor subunit [Bacteroidetes bacterium]|nr:efflux RND transporter periplasmic adaptor subunit [Bacteroidota bacterium]
MIRRFTFAVQNKNVIPKLTIRTLLPCCIAFLLYSCTNNQNNQQGAGPGGFDTKPKDYAVLALNPRHAKINFDFPATIQGQQIIEIRPKVDGYVDQIYVKEGATVKKGQLLFRIKNPQYEQDVLTATASIKSALASVDAAKMEVAKVKPLVEKDIVSKYELESAQYTLEAREATLAQAKAALANAQTNLGYTTLRSPQDGVIGNIPYKVGALVNSTNVEALTTLSNIGNVYAYYSMNEKQLLQFFATTPGKTIQEKTEQLAPATLLLADGTEYPEKGKVETASGLISTETGTASFKAIYPNPLGIIRSGASATVRIPTIIEDALVIPQSATYELQDKRLVYVLSKDHKVFSTAITTTSTDDGKFFIVNKGLASGDTIVLEGLIGLKDDATIIPKAVSADSVYSKKP